jgi:hypothetical protein
MEMTILVLVQKSSIEFVLLVLKWKLKEQNRKPISKDSSKLK